MDQLNDDDDDNDDDDTDDAYDQMTMEQLTCLKAKNKAKKRRPWATGMRKSVVVGGEQVGEVIMMDILVVLQVVEPLFIETRRYSPLCGPSSSSGGEFWCSAEAFFALLKEKEKSVQHSFSPFY